MLRRRASGCHTIPSMPAAPGLAGLGGPSFLMSGTSSIQVGAVTVIDYLLRTQSIPDTRREMWPLVMPPWRYQPAVG